MTSRNKPKTRGKKGDRTRPSGTETSGYSDESKEVQKWKMNKPKRLLRQQHQTLSGEVFDKIVREEIERCFHIRYLTDRGLQNLFDPEYRRSIEAEVVTPQQLKDEMHDLFFRSLYEVYREIKNRRIGTSYTGKPLTVGMRDSEKTRIWWDNTYDVVAEYKIIDERRKEIYERTTGKQVAKDEYGHDIDFDIGDIKTKFRHMWVYFEGRIKYEDESWYNIVKYTIDLNKRIEIIVNYVLDKNIDGPLIESCSGMKQMTEEERKIVRSDGTTAYGLDPYPLVKRYINELLRMQKFAETVIWRPRENPNIRRNEVCIESD